jgi:hypothetical protein
MKEILCTVSNTGMYFSSNKVGEIYLVIYFRKFHRQYQFTLQGVWHVVLLDCTVISLSWNCIHIYVYLL